MLDTPKKFWLGGVRYRQ